MKPSAARGHLDTERSNPSSEKLDLMSTTEGLSCILDEDAGIVGAVRNASKEIVAAVDLIVPRLREGGRLFYVGAGTSGRLGLLDAVECPPTFQTEPGQVQAILAGGPGAFLRSVEGAEDQFEGALPELTAATLSERDIVLGIAAGGTTPFVHGALQFARERSAATIFLACVSADQVTDAADVSIRVLTGPEVLTGSTRMKAGTATKLVLNAISTLSMTRLGKVHGNLMVDLNAGANSKLIERGVRMIQEITDASATRALELLERASYRVKVACVMHVHGLDPAEATAQLEHHFGHLRAAVSTDSETRSRPTK